MTTSRCTPLFVAVIAFGSGLVGCSGPARTPTESHSGGPSDQDTGLAISGTIVDPRGVAVSRVTIEVYPEPYRYESVAKVHSAEDGSFRVEPLEAGRYVLRLATTWVDPARSLAAVRYSGVEAGTTDARLELPEADPIEGRVVSERGEPLYDIVVFASETDLTDWPDAACRTDRDGSFVLDIPRGSVVDIRAFPQAPAEPLPLDPGYRYRADAERVRAGTKDVELRLEALVPPPRLRR